MEFISLMLMEGAKQEAKGQKSKAVMSLTFFYSSFTFKLIEFKPWILKLSSTYNN